MCDLSFKRGFLFKIDSLQDYAFRALILGRLELHQRYKRSVLGIWWSLATPLTTVMVYFLVFRELIRIDYFSDSEYIVYLISGVILVQFTVQTVTLIAESFANKVGLIKRIRIQPLLLANGVLFASIFNFFVSLLPLVIMLILQNSLSPRAFFLIPLLPLMSYFLLAIGLMCAVLYTLFDDSKALIRILISFLPFFTPVFYTLDQIPFHFRMIVENSPITFFLTLFRWCIGFPEAIYVRHFGYLIFVVLFIPLVFFFFNKIWKRVVWLL